MLRRSLPPILGLWLAAGCGGSSSETPFPLEPELSRLDAGGPPSSAEYVVFTGQSSEPAPEPPPEPRKPPPEPEEVEPEPLAPRDAGVILDAGKPVDAGKPADGSVVQATGARPATPRPLPRVRDAGHD